MTESVVIQETTHTVALKCHICLNSISEANMCKPIERYVFDAKSLSEKSLFHWKCHKKQMIFDYCSSNVKFEGEIVYSRWNQMKLYSEIASESKIDIKKGYYKYKECKNNEKENWYVNFADPDLFISCITSLLAQDEIQVLEHPLLCAIRKNLLDKDIFPETIDKKGNPTPITIRGVQRICEINTLLNSKTGRTIYGKAFATSSESDIKKCLRKINPPTISNILAIAALPAKSGYYSKEDIFYLILTAYTGFKAAKLESLNFKENCKTIINTGFWGCGAFGGNKKLMAIIQFLAADLAATELKFWSFNSEGYEIAKNAYICYLNLKNKTKKLSLLIDLLFEEKFEWNKSDYN